MSFSVGSSSAWTYVGSTKGNVLARPHEVAKLLQNHSSGRSQIPARTGFSAT